MDDQITALSGLLRVCAKTLRRIATESRDGASHSLAAASSDLERIADRLDHDEAELMPTTGAGTGLQ